MANVHCADSKMLEWKGLFAHCVLRDFSKILERTMGAG